MNEEGKMKNEYVALREAKIARNEARLRALGLLSPEKPAPPPPAPRKKKRKSLSSSPPAIRPPHRRSARLRSSPPVDYYVDEEPMDRTFSSKRLQTRSSSNASVVSGSQHPAPPLSAWELQDLGTVAPPPAPVDPSENSGSRMPNNSARAIRLDVQKLLASPNLLGVPSSAGGKAHVMEESARLAAAADDERGRVSFNRISFNKYAGIQEWGGDGTMFLWVNLHAPNCDFVNDFSEGGRHVAFYGGARMRDETRVIQKLKRAGALAAAGKLPPEQGVVLWCRRYLSERKTFGPYVCLGRLSVSCSTNIQR